MPSTQVAQASSQASKTDGKMWFTSEQFEFTHTAGESLTLSGSKDGTAPFTVDDYIEVRITTWTKGNDARTTRTWSHDFSNGCSTKNEAHPPKDLTEFLRSYQNNRNKVTVNLFDRCGTKQGSSDIYLNGSIAPVSPAPEPVTPPSSPTPTVPAPAPATRYVAMGDSYHSGEGAPPFDSNTDARGNLCHRSLNAAAVHLARSP